MRSPGLFQRQPSSCWCSVYWSRRSWKTTRMMLWNSDKFPFYNKFEATHKYTNTHTWIWPWRHQNAKSEWSLKFEAHLHHFISYFGKFPNFPVVKHSDFIGLACNEKIMIDCCLSEGHTVVPTCNCSLTLQIFLRHGFCREIALLSQWRFSVIQIVADVDMMNFNTDCVSFSYWCKHFFFH